MKNILRYYKMLWIYFRSKLTISFYKNIKQVATISFKGKAAYIFGVKNTY